MLTALIDADMIVYRAGFSSQQNLFNVVKDNGDIIHTLPKMKDAKEFIEFLELSGEGEYTIDKDVIGSGHDEADRILDHLIQKIMKNTKATDYVLYLTGHSNFRKDVAVYQEYKGNRKDTKKPIYYNHIRGKLYDDYDALVSINEEADDLLAIHQTQSDTPTIICTGDKDLKTVPGLNYNLQSEEIIYVTKADANRFFAEQILMGDSADHIPGISTYSNKKKRVGPKTATKLIKDATSPDELYTLVADAYEKHAGDNWEDKLLETASLLHMQRKMYQTFSIEDWVAGKYN